MDRPWLVVIDMQRVFADPSSGWAVEGYAGIEPLIESLAGRHPGRVVYTRFVRDPDEPGQWGAYYDRWPGFRLDAGDPAWTLTVEPAPGDPVVVAPTFGKWGPALEAVVGTAPLLLCGVATECCVLATAFAAADAGRQVRVVADACAGSSRSAHQDALRVMDLNAPLLTVVTSADLPI